ncbi:MAG TPA: hypothetical protein VFO40_04705, partial [Chthoniobacterales bacterium]|nr:hypothetical protein [Chthoniobacterales bacterium]
RPLIEVFVMASGGQDLWTDWISTEMILPTRNGTDCDVKAAVPTDLLRHILMAKILAKVH